MREFKVGDEVIIKGRNCVHPCEYFCIGKKGIIKSINGNNVYVGSLEDDGGGCSAFTLKDLELVGKLVKSGVYGIAIFMEKLNKNEIK